VIQRGFGLISSPKDEIELNLISGFNDEVVEEKLTLALNVMCPELESSQRLQDKALRLVFSVGVDAVLVDAESSGYMGKIAIQPEDLLSSEATEGVFGTFCIPK
jgi:hypothetical protein